MGFGDVGSVDFPDLVPFVSVAEESLGDREKGVAGGNDIIVRQMGGWFD